MHCLFPVSSPVKKVYCWRLSYVCFRCKVQNRYHLNFLPKPVVLQGSRRHFSTQTNAYSIYTWHPIFIHLVQSVFITTKQCVMERSGRSSKTQGATSNKSSKATSGKMDNQSLLRKFFV